MEGPPTVAAQGPQFRLCLHRIAQIAQQIATSGGDATLLGRTWGGKFNGKGRSQMLNIWKSDGMKWYLYCLRDQNRSLGILISNQGRGWRMYAYLRIDLCRGCPGYANCLYVVICNWWISTINPYPPLDSTYPLLPLFAPSVFRQVRLNYN